MITLFRIIAGNSLRRFFIFVIVQRSFTHLILLCECVHVCVAPSVLRECGRHPERQQLDHCVNRRQDVLLESGHALPASGTQTMNPSSVTQPAISSKY